MLTRLTPERPDGRSGVLVLVAALLVGSGCDAIGGGETVELDSATVDVPGAVHEIELAGSGASGAFSPESLTVRAGDAVRFTAADARPHAVAFEVDSLEPTVRQYLEETGQLRGPPLVSEGTTWLVMLEDAPPGSYPFYCRSHDAHGRLTVAAAE